MQLTGLGARHHVGPLAQHQSDVGPGEGVDARGQIGLDAGGAAVILAPDEGPPMGVAADADLGIRGQPVALGLAQRNLRGSLRLEQTWLEQDGQQPQNGSDRNRLTGPHGLDGGRRRAVAGAD
jgi:hypothetical protein